MICKEKEDKRRLCVLGPRRDARRARVRIRLAADADGLGHLGQDLPVGSGRDAVPRPDTGVLNGAQRQRGHY